MPGCPIRRARQSGARDANGAIIAFPRLSRPRAGLSHAQWRALSPGEKLERLFGMSLDDIYEIMSWPIGELDPLRLSVRMQVLRVVFPIGAKALLDGTLGREATRERNRAAALARVDEALRARAPAASGRDDQALRASFWKNGVGERGGSKF